MPLITHLVFVFLPDITQKVPATSIEIIEFAANHIPDRYFLTSSENNLRLLEDCD